MMANWVKPKEINQNDFGLKCDMCSPFLKDLDRYRYSGKLEWYDLSLWVILIYRIGQYCSKFRPAWFRQILRIIHFPFFALATIISGIHLPRGARIGGGLRIWHFGGIILNAHVVMGENCTLRPGVVIGILHSDDDVPVIGNNVDIGVGAKILGAIHIGDNVKIGANAVVITDVPDNCTAVGIPARVLRRGHSL
jgi:serine O-acetyltransferase